MTTKTKKKPATPPPLEKTPTSDHVLLEPDEWKDPEDRKVIAEFHKDTHASSGTEKGRNEEKQSSQGDERTEEKTQKTPIQHIIDLGTIELMMYTLSRALFRQGVKVPVYMKGAVDMDIAVKDTDVIINTNDVSFEPPPLQIWHIIFTYKGKPVLEYGRGVKNTMKIHRVRAVLFLLAMWAGGRKHRKAREKATLEACQDLAENPPEKIEKKQRKTSGDQ
jgi:hypothetical protein